MLVIDMGVLDGNGKRNFADISAVRREAHPRIPNAFYYDYRACIDDTIYTGRVLHSYQNGGLALTVKITKAILTQQKAERAKNDT